MIDWYLKVVRDNYANFSGRARRSEYWYYTLCGGIIGIVLRILDFIIGLDFNLLGTIYSLAVFIPGLAVLVRRFHDVGKSGWYVVWTMLPIIIGAGCLMGLAFRAESGFTFWHVLSILLFFGGAIWGLVLTCTNGDVGANEYGLDPKQPYEDIDAIGAEETDTY
jgi:uncharacterized membrane protein YhaH (DUF805 family)